MVATSFSVQGNGNFSALDAEVCCFQRLLPLTTPPLPHENSCHNGVEGIECCLRPACACPYADRLLHTVTTIYTAIFHLAETASGCHALADDNLAIGDQLNSLTLSLHLPSAKATY